MPKKLTRIQQQDALMAYAEKRLREIGATDTPPPAPDRTPMYPLTFATKAGPLGFSLSRDVITMRREPVSITLFGRFDDHEKAKTIVTDSGYTGKWNHHGLETEADIDMVIERVARMKPEQAEAA